MRTQLLSKHQRLILQCYPPGNVGDKRPNASELSYLLYYVSTRRVKLSKVGAYLEKNNRQYVYRGKSGNVDVTLEIIKALIERCHEDLNVFADHVIAILYQVLQSNDLALCQHASQVFAVFCKHHIAALFTGDPRYANSVCDLTSKFVSVATSEAKGPNVIQWNMLGVEAAKSVAASEIITTVRAERLVSLLIPVVLDAITVDEDGLVLTEIKTKLDAQKRKREAAASSSRPSVEVNTPERAGAASEANDEDEDPPSPSEQLQVLAGDALQAFFDTLGGAQSQVVTRTTVKYLLDKAPPIAWSKTLITTIARWTPVQLRFVVLSVLVDELAHLPLADVESQKTVAHLIAALLSSNVSMVGLSVIDILRKLTSQQHAIIGNEISGGADRRKQQHGNNGAGLSSNSDQKEVLVEIIRDCIASIATHIYYADQISNMISETIARTCHEESSTRQDTGRVPSSTNITAMAAAATFSSMDSRGTNQSSTNGQKSITSSNPNNESKAEDILVCDFKNIRAILQVSSSQSAAGIEMNKVPLHAWEGSQSMLLHNSRKVREAYSSAFLTYLRYGVSEADKGLKLHKNFNVTHGTIGRFALKLYVAAIEKDSQRVDYITIAHLLTGVIHQLGVNAIARVLPFTLMLQDIALDIEHGNSSVYYLEQGVAISSICLIALDAISAVLGLEDMSRQVKKRVEERVKNDTWYSVLDFPLKHDLGKDLLEKKSVDFSPADPHKTAKSKAVTREDLAKVVVIQDFPSDLVHVLFDEAPVSDDNAIAATDNSDSVQGDVSVVPHQARSLKQLRVITNSGFNTSQENINSNGGMGVGGLLNTRDFSPKVSDLKRVASGILKPDGNGFMRSTRNTNGAESVMSSQTPSMRSFSTAEEPSVNVNGHKNKAANFDDKLDISSFLTGMSLHSVNDRGRLV